MTKRALIVGCLALIWVGTQPGCLEDKCKVKSAQVELVVSFSDTGGAQRLEFETRVVAPGAPGAAHEPDYITLRRGSIPFPSLSDGEATFLMDPGPYVHNLVEGERATFTVILRAYGEKAGEPDALLAEGRWEGTVSPGGCYINTTMSVSNQRTCADKQEGDPCVASSGEAFATCMYDVDRLTCTDSTCGDGFTDRRNGEICDPTQSGSSVLCDANCLPIPPVLRVAPAATGTATQLEGGDQINLNFATPTDGFWAVDEPVDATGAETSDLAATLLIADLDGDGVDELALGLPGAPVTHGSAFDSERAGIVLVEDWHLNADQILGQDDDGMYKFVGARGQSDDRGSWLGAALAVGDLDGNGTPDLVMGAPRLNTVGEESGGVYVIFGGEDAGYLTADKSAVVLDLEEPTASSSYQSFQAVEGAFAGGRGDHLGYALAIADLNLDGFSDLAVAAPHRKNADDKSHGSVYVLRGKPDWDRETDNVGIQGRATLEIETFIENCRLGVSLATGDLNGDGYPDLIMGTVADATHMGGVVVLFGGADLLPPERNDVLEALPNPVPELLSLAPDAGHPLAGMGGTVAAVDLDGDGLDELVTSLGRPGADAATQGNPEAVVIISGRFFAREQGGLALPSANEHTVLRGPQGSRFGLVLTATDVSGDRRPDLLVSAPWAADPSDGDERAGAVYAILATPRTHLWDHSELVMDDLMSWTLGQGDVPLPVILLQGTDANGQLGVATAGSSHLAQRDEGWRYRNAYTYVLQAGYNNGIHPFAGRIYSLFLPAALPCESYAPCEPLSP